jgi:hypothetical protein
VSTGFCENHSFEGSENDCGQCGRSFCSECLVYPFGPKRPPLCKACAIAAAGIRKNGGRAPVASRRELRRQQRERRRSRREQTTVTPEPASPMTAAMEWVPGQPTEPEPVIEPVAEEQPGYAGSSSVGAGVAAGLGFSVDEQELHEIRPSFDGRLTRTRH